MQYRYEIKMPLGMITLVEALKEIDVDKAVRAVGNANHNNPIVLVVTCHRVIGTNGKLTGYALGLDKKEFLLKLEKAL